MKTSFSSKTGKMVVSDSLIFSIKASKVFDSLTGLKLVLINFLISIDCKMFLSLSSVKTSPLSAKFLMSNEYGSKCFEIAKLIGRNYH